MRWMFVPVVTMQVLMLAFAAGPLHAQPKVRVIAKHVPMDIYEIVRYDLQCPSGYVPINYSMALQYPYDDNEEQARDLIDRGGAALNRDAIAAAAQIDGAGFEVQVFNTEHHVKSLEALATCLATAVSPDNTLQLVKSAGSAAKQTTGTATSFCPADAPVAYGGFSTADGRFLRDAASAPVWGASGSPLALLDVPDGATGPPTGWQMKVFNNISPTPGFSVYALCGKATPGLQTFVYSVPVPQGAFGFTKPLTIFSAVPDGWTAMGVGFDLGPSGVVAAADFWMQDGNIVDALQWFDNTTGYDSAASEVRAYIVHGGGNAPSGTTPRAVSAVLAVPAGGTVPPATVTVVEFYNASLDHYFITAIADEIAKLDDGTFKGWARTGQSFKAYAVGSSGRAGRRPVCREYGKPEWGLDSHFYSANPDECQDTMANTLGAWGLEASEVFQVDLPDPVSGACPPNGVPVYRVWNQRRDSNHRYMTSTAIRDQMVAKGGVAEGYGPDSVVLCGLP